jgi:TatD DNase family protein
MCAQKVAGSGQGGIGDVGVELVDAHAHLDFDQFDADRDEVIGRATEDGVTRIVTVGFDLDSSRKALKLTDSYANVRACVGVHPHEASQVNSQVLDALRELSKDPKVVAIGEIGLDYYRDRSPRDAQRRAFREQLELAANEGKPVVVHDRAAHEDVTRMIRAWVDAISSCGLRLRAPLGVVHCFSGGAAMARELSELGFYISIAGPVTFPNAAALQEVVRALPLKSLLVETDCPFLSPHPYRGKRNEPARVKLVAQKIAEIKGLPLEEVARKTTKNASRAFRLH